MTFIKGTVTFVDKAVTFIGGAATFINGAMTFIGKGSPAIKGKSFETARVRLYYC